MVLARCKQGTWAAIAGEKPLIAGYNNEISQRAQD